MCCPNARVCYAFSLHRLARARAAGIVSSVHRNLNGMGLGAPELSADMEYIQTDAAITVRSLPVPTPTLLSL